MSEISPSSEMKRFNVSPESMHLMQESKKVFEEIKKDNPYLSGIGFFGSRARGNEKPDSDLDAIIFYNSDRIELDESERNVRFQTIKSEISRGIKVPLGDHVGWYKDISVIKTDIDLFSLIRYSERLHAISSDDKLKAISRYPQAQNLFSRFFLAIGEEVYESRAYLLDQLAELKNGDQIFGELMGALSVFEADNRPQKTDILQYANLPRTISAAREYFRIPRV